MKKQSTMDSLQPFGYNRFNLHHSVLGSYNFGKAYPIGWRRVKVGDTIHNNIEAFMRSSALGDPSFLDAEISIGHYFVPYACFDPLYRSRCARFKGTGSDQRLPFVSCTEIYVRNQEERTVTTIFKPGSLMDHLGLSIRDLPEDASSPTPSGYVNFDLSPIAAYHIIMDKFFTNSKLQNAMFTREYLTQKLAATMNTQGIYITDLLGEQDSPNAEPVWNVPLGDSLVNANFFALRYVNQLPDYFTTSRPTASGPNITIPGTADAPGTIHELLDAMIKQKVGDKLQRGGYSYDDYIRVLFGISGVENESNDPIFLGGSSGPLQVSTVVNTADELGAQGGNVSGSSRYDNGFTHTFAAEGIYMPILFIRPSTYYNGGVLPEWRQTSIASRVIPEMADLSDDAVLQSEVSASALAFCQDYIPTLNPSVFGYKDRYEEQRTAWNRVVGELHTTRTGWYIETDKYTGSVSNQFISSERLRYTPWLVQDKTVDHFFARIYQDLEITSLLPVVSKPWVW